MATPYANKTSEVKQPNAAWRNLPKMEALDFSFSSYFGIELCAFDTIDALKAPNDLSIGLPALLKLPLIPFRFCYLASKIYYLFSDLTQDINQLKKNPHWLAYEALLGHLAHNIAQTVLCSFQGVLDILEIGAEGAKTVGPLVGITASVATLSLVTHAAVVATSAIAVGASVLFTAYSCFNLYKLTKEYDELQSDNFESYYEKQNALIDKEFAIRSTKLKIAFGATFALFSGAFMATSGLGILCIATTPPGWVAGLTLGLTAAATVGAGLYAATSLAIMCSENKEKKAKKNEIQKAKFDEIKVKEHTTDPLESTETSYSVTSDSQQIEEPSSAGDPKHHAEVQAQGQELPSAAVENHGQRHEHGNDRISNNPFSLFSSSSASRRSILDSVYPPSSLSNTTQY